MSQAAPILREIKSVFNNQGINNDLQIASHLGFLLLVADRWEEFRRATQLDLERLLTEAHSELEEWVRTTFSVHSNLPQSPSRQFRGSSLYEVLDIIDRLSAAMNESLWHDAGDFFQHEIRFEIKNDVRRGFYPTPYHLADFMAALAVSHGELPIRVVDLAAGTGGLLAAALRYAPNAELIGYEFNPNVAEVGIANLLLHYPGPRIEFYQESSLSEVAQWTEQSADSVIVNPPFGGTLNTAQAELLRNRIRDDNYGRSVHTLFAAITLQMLRTRGRAAFLLPSLTGSGGDERLRRNLLERHTLEAVITLRNED